MPDTRGLEQRRISGGEQEHRCCDVVQGSRRGDADPLLLLHAFPLNGKMFEPQMEALSATRRVIAPDLPGFGRSPRTPAQPDVGYYAGCVRALLDRLEVPRVVLGGVSMGGYVAFECLRSLPERVSGLVLANTRPDADTEEARETRKEMALRVAQEGIGVLVELQMERLLSPRPAPRTRASSRRCARSSWRTRRTAPSRL